MITPFSFNLTGHSFVIYKGLTGPLITSVIIDIRFTNGLIKPTKDYLNIFNVYTLHYLLP